MTADNDKQGSSGRSRRDGSPSLPDWAVVFRTTERLRLFQRALDDYFAQTNVRVVIEDGWVVPQGEEHDGIRWGLSNLAAMCAGAEDEEWADLISTHFDTIRESFDEDDLNSENTPPEEMRRNLVLRLWEENAFDGAKVDLVTRSDIPGLATVLCVELPTSIRNLRPDECPRLGTHEELFAIALRNVERVAEPQVQELELPDGDGATITLISGESFVVASLALVIGERFPSIFGPHGAFVSLPERHTILAMPLSTPAALKAISRLITLTHQASVESPGAISPRVWWTDGKGRWIELPYEIENNKLAVSAPPELVAIMNQLV